MSKSERTGIRILTYSGWHRESRIRRYLTTRQAAQLDMIDVDSCEACCYCKEPVALIETQASKEAPKAARITAALARLAHIPAYSVSYEPDADGGDIVTFQVRQIQPPDPKVVVMLPKVYAYWLLALRDQHHRTAHPDALAEPVTPPKLTHDSCDCTGHMGFHVDCDSCRCDPVALGAR